MRRSSVALLALLVLAALPLSAAIKGDYLEVRSADVYTGPCFANAEVGLVGDQAILAWKIHQGSWQGVSLNGLGVVAVVKANATLGDPFSDPLPAKSVLIVDKRATSAQRAALTSLARSMAGPLLSNVVRVDLADISLQTGAGMQHGNAALSAGKIASVKTRALASCDLVCGNETTYYKPLVQLTHSMPAYTLAEAFSGAGLGAVWNRVDKRSAFVGTFSF